MVVETERRSTANPLYEGSDDSEAQEHDVLVTGEPSVLPVMKMKDQDEVATDIKRLRRNAACFVAFIIVQALITMGMVCFGIVMTQEYGLKTDTFYTTLYKNGKYGGLKDPSNTKAQLAKSFHDKIPLSSSKPDSYLKKLDRIDMSFSLPASEHRVDTSTVHRHLLHLQQGHQYRVSANVKGFIRRPCETCSSGNEVMISTNIGNLLLRDEISIPYFKPGLFTGLDTEALRQHVATAQVSKYNKDINILAGVLANATAPDAVSASRKLQSSNSVSFQMSSDKSNQNHFSSTYSHTFTGNSHSSLQGSLDFKADYNANSGSSSGSIGVSLHWG